MSTAICFILDQSKILSSGNGLLCHALPLANRCYKKICIEPIKKPEENHTVSILSNYIADLRRNFLLSFKFSESTILPHDSAGCVPKWNL